MDEWRVSHIAQDLQLEVEPARKSNGPEGAGKREGGIAASGGKPKLREPNAPAAPVRLFTINVELVAILLSSSWRQQ